MSDFSNTAKHEIALTLALRRSDQSKLSAGQTYRYYQLLLYEISNEEPLSSEDYEKTAQDYVARLKAEERRALMGK